MIKLLLALAFCQPPLHARQPAVAGAFYPADKAELAAYVDRALAAPAPPRPDGEIVAAIVPHAGYVFSGQAAATAYKYLADSYDTVVILATGHTEKVRGAAVFTGGHYETPLGRVPNDDALAAALVKASPLFEARPSAHAREHAVEVQLPFLQRRLKKPFKLLGATLNSDSLADMKAVGAALAKALKGRKAVMLISADLSHYPPAPVAAAADGAVALAVETLDPEQLWHTTRFIMQKRPEGLDTCACGEAAMQAGMEAARLLGARSFRRLKLTHSHAEFPAGAPENRVVGYLTGLFVKAGAPSRLELAAGQKEALLREARATVADAFEGRSRPAALDSDPRLNLPGAVFVTLTLDGALRGCIGTVTPSFTLLDAVRYAAYSAAFRDSRFRPLTRAELEKVKMEVSLLSPMERIAHGRIIPHKHGVVVRKGESSGLFLPQVWEQLPAKEEFLGELCSQKAGLPRACWKDPSVELYSFTVDSFSEK